MIRTRLKYLRLCPATATACATLLAPLVLLGLSGLARAQPAGEASAMPAPGPGRNDPPMCAPAACVTAEPAAAVPAEPPPSPSPSPSSPRPNPRLDLSVSSFSIGNGGAATVPLTGLELNLYALSSAWLRAGLSAAAGRGHGIISGAGTTAGIDTAVRYGMLGVTAAFQVPTRFSPFIAGSLAGGVLAGSTDGALSIPGTSVSLSGGSGATWIYTRGIDVGAQLYTFGSLHLTGSVGWVRATWRGLDTVAMSASASANPSAGIRFKSVGNDSVAIKLGLGF